jgi:hypothetical protein
MSSLPTEVAEVSVLWMDDLSNIQHSIPQTLLLQELLGHFTCQLI